MSTVCTVLKNIENLSQTVVNFLSNPKSLSSRNINSIVTQIELIRGGLRELPITSKLRNDIFNRLTQAQSIIQNNSLSKIERLLAVSQILQVITLKLKNLKRSCPQGITTVVPSNTFNTICDSCH